MEAIATRREIVVRGFFWALLVSVSLMTAYFLAIDGANKPPVAQQNPADQQQQVSMFKAALEKKPNDLRTLVSLGDTYLNMNNVRDAYRIFLRAEKVAPNDAHVLNDLGSIYQQIGQYDRALDSYRRAYQSKPDHSSSLLNMALIYSQHKGEYAKALELLRTFLAGNPEVQLIGTAKQEIARIERLMKESGGAASQAPATNY